MPTPTANKPSMVPEAEADLIILGGGCAGLSLASHLALWQNPPRVIIVEPRTTYTEDRTWCGWRTAPHLFDDCAISQFKQWRIADSESESQHEIIRSSERYPYQMISSIRVYEKAQGLIGQSPSMTLLLNTSATTLNEDERKVTVTLNNATKIIAPWVIDTRPKQQLLHHPWLWQNFVGYVVHLGTTHHSQWGDIPTLMDFQPAGCDVVQFLYIIPIAPNEYLCEWTRFSKAQGQQSEIEADLNAWLNAQLGSGYWSMKRRESGSLPMAHAPSEKGTRIIAAGTRGGSMRASTGYAFHAIQRWAAVCTAAIEATGRPLAPPNKELLNRMDDLFLRVLQQPDRSAAGIFQSLFAEAPPDALIRFLSGIPDTADLWPIVRPLPWLSFLQAIPATLLSRPQPLEAKKAR